MGTEHGGGACDDLTELCSCVGFDSRLHHTAMTVIMCCLVVVYCACLLRLQEEIRKTCANGRYKGSLCMEKQPCNIVGFYQRCGLYAYDATSL